MKLLLKYNPPKITLMYHVLGKADEQYIHDVPIEKRMLEHSSPEDICSHLYMSEGYYFNPKQLKRAQVRNRFSGSHLAPGHQIDSNVKG